jgi:hypothetical protein
MTDIYERIIEDGEHNQIRLVINEFNGIEYLHLRKYYLSFEEEWLPSNVGISFPLDLQNSKELFAGLAEILSNAESKEVIKEYFKELLQEIYEK